jgi:hypothetical protein
MVLKQSYYWAYAIHQGKLVILGAFQTREQAYQTAYTRLPSDFQIIELTTKNQAKATQIIKFQLLNTTGDLDFSMQKSKHQL